MHPSGLQAATPFMANIVLLVFAAAITGWMRDHVENVYNDAVRRRDVVPPSFGRPEALGYLALWGADLGTLLGTVAVTAGASAGMLQSKLDPSLLVYAAMALTVVVFAVAIRFVSPLRYRRFIVLGVSVLIWGALLLNAGLIAYSFGHYG